MNLQPVPLANIWNAKDSAVGFQDCPRPYDGGAERLGENILEETSKIWVGYSGI